jgi:hypothetical protein
MDVQLGFQLGDALARCHEFGLIAAGEDGYLPGLVPKKPRERISMSPG